MMTFIFGSAEADKAFAWDVVLYFVLAIVGRFVVMKVLKALIWVTTTVNGWVQESRARDCWRVK